MYDKEGMINQELADIFNEIADILDIKGIDWKPNAYRNAARAIQGLSEDILVIYKKGGITALEEIPGIGEGLAKKIEQFIKTGKINEYERLKKTVPGGIKELMRIPGMGPKKIKKLYIQLKISSVKELKQAIKEEKIRKLKGFGLKSEEDILKNLGLASTARSRKLLSEVLPIAKKIVNRLKKLKSVKKIEIAGSIRRKKPTVRDIDILIVSSNPKPVMDLFVSMQDVHKIIAKGLTKSSVFLKEGYGCDLRIVAEKSFGAALLYFTGSKDFNIWCRQVAIRKGLKLSEYGLFKGEKMIAGRTEKEVLDKLGIKYIAPELRENRPDSGRINQKKAEEFMRY